MSKVAIITGSSGGIGKSIVKTYINDGYSVVGIDVMSNAEFKHEFYQELEIDLYRYSKNLNYRNESSFSIKSCLPSKIDKLVIINNAAKQIVKRVSDIAIEDWDEIIYVNVIAPFFLVQDFIELLRDTNGHVINISSVHSKLTKREFLCYAASKAAIESITRSLAIELSPMGISVNAVAPAAISTKMLEEGFSSDKKGYDLLKSFHPSRSIGNTEELSNFIKAITDQETRFLTGAVLEFTGGISGKLHDPE